MYRYEEALLRGLKTVLLLAMAMALFASNPGRADSTGTGFFYNSRGDILTNRHVIDGCSRVRIRLPNKSIVDGRIIAISSEFDLAAIRTDFPTKRFASIPVKNRYPLIPTGGEDVFTYGYSYEKAGFDGWAIAGVIVPEPRIERKYYLKARMDVSPGSSGSPVLGRHNLLIGIVTAGREMGRIPEDGWDDYLGTKEIYLLNGNALTHFINESEIYASTWESDRGFTPIPIINHAMEITSLIICETE